MATYNKRTFVTFRKAITTAGTAEQLHSDLPIPDGFQLVIKALDGNSGNIEIAPTEQQANGSDVFVLDASQSIGLYLQNANAVWMDTDSSGDGVVCIVEMQ